MQYYIVTGGTGPWGYGSLRSSEILKKDGGQSWQTAASLPFISRFVRGVSLANGQFMVAGEEYSCIIASYSSGHIYNRGKRFCWIRKGTQ